MKIQFLINWGQIDYLYSFLSFFYIFLFEEPKDYQDQLKKSPGVPHDPDRQPSGGVLKRNASSQAKTAKTGGDQRGPKAGRVPFRM